MKNLLLLTLTLFMGFNLFSQNSNLTVFSENGNPFYVILNGIRQNENPETNVRVNDLMNEYYSLKLIFGDQNIPTIERKILMVVDADARKGEMTYKIKRHKKGHLVLRYFSFTPAAQVLPPPATVAVVHYNTKPMPVISFGANVSTTTTTTSSSTTTNSNPNNVNANINIAGINLDVNVNDNFDSQYATTTSVSTTTTTHSNVPNDVYVEEPCYPMSNASFQSALNSIESKSFSDTKMSQAKQVSISNCLTAKQIKSMCKLFSFEDDKLTFAKFAFNSCVDKNNYWEINDIFSFSSTTEELNEFIQSK